MLRPFTALALLAGLTVSLYAAKPDRPEKPAKKEKEFVAAKPAFTPDPAVPAFDPNQVTPEHLDTSMFKVPEGMEISVWATSPMLFNPANMDVDAEGRVWVAEGINYRRHSGRSREGDAIRVLEDTDGDGKADKSHVFVREKELECPLGVAVFDNVIVVSNAPNIIVYTDVNRDLKFDPAVDKREVLLDGFEQPQHDHSLHAVYAGPDGRWYFSNGNCGAQFSDKSGNTFRIGSGYLNNSYTGEKSDDGHVYVGGFTASLDPSGHNVRILGYNYRNSFEGVRNSFGDMYLNDNDDPPACRVSHLIEGGSFGFFSPDGKRQWRADKRPGQTIAVAEWRQDDPGSIPAGDVYGGGAPTGMTFYENGALGDKWKGLLLSCETGRNVVFGYLPKPDGAGMKLERFDFCTSNTTGVFKGSDFVGGKDNMSDERHTLFRPSDVCVGMDGAIYISDWFDKRTGGHMDTDETCSGTIYRIVPKGTNPKVTKVNYDTIEGQIAALKSPANNVRHTGFVKLKEQGDKALPAVTALLDDANPYIAARAVWLLAQMGEKGNLKVRTWLESDDANKRLVALRALRAAGGDLMHLFNTLAADDSAAVRSEIAVAMRDVPFAQSEHILVELAKRSDGQDRSYLEAWGIGCTGKEAEVWAALHKLSNGVAPEEWTNAFAQVTWRLHPAAAVEAVKTRALSSKLSAPQRKLALDTLAFTQDASAAQAMLAVAKDKESPIHGDAMWWLINRSTNDWSSYNIAGELKAQGIFDPEATKLVTIETPPAMPSLVKLDEVLALKGDAKNGSSLVVRCVMCHQINHQGVEFGPSLQGWGLSQPTDIIAQAILEPSKDIAHGFEGMEIVTKDGIKIHGMVLTDGDVLIVRSMGGQTQFVPKSRIASRKKMDRSLMLSASQLGLSAQDIADIVAYMRQTE
ncbi:putative membrane-bound dehydrogenase domain-containing protein [Prosthecobacter debontii]|uniref:Putative membrane-bound dehydrogenase domain-containing protein n=1 Tax=Prosthecobacter debontii TaxID=48467 RepID=A0A1T4YM37_9BACT|nr:PVC-type heme-binding CxxCH protein [Prosthecobacter debontii]SKB02887.1 putative membrane-bound dehydrogenase domain-containing protein [Prosthecobacter debontii]